PPTGSPANLDGVRLSTGYPATRFTCAQTTRSRHSVNIAYLLPPSDPSGITLIARPLHAWDSAWRVLLACIKSCAGIRAAPMAATYGAGVGQTATSCDVVEIRVV